MTLLRRFAAITLCTLLLSGCTSEDDLPSNDGATVGDSTSGDGATDGPAGSDGPACQLATSGPFVRGLQAAPNAASAATVKADDKVYELELIADFAGWVIYEAQQGGRVLLYLGVEAPLMVHDSAGTAIELLGGGSTTSCELLVIRYAVELPEAGSYLLRVGGSGVPQQKTLLVLKETA